MISEERNIGADEGILVSKLTVDDSTSYSQCRGQSTNKKNKQSKL